MQVVRTGSAAGATINVTWAGGPHVTPAEQETSMARFANALEALVRAGATNLRWATVANEPNRVKTLTPPRLAALYQKLDAQLEARGCAGRSASWAAISSRGR